MSVIDEETPNCPTCVDYYFDDEDDKDDDKDDDDYEDDQACSVRFGHPPWSPATGPLQPGMPRDARLARARALLDPEPALARAELPKETRRLLLELQLGDAVAQRNEDAMGDGDE